MEKKRYRINEVLTIAGIPQRGESGFRFRDFEAVLRTVKRVVKTQGVSSRRKCPPQQAPVREVPNLFSDFVKKLKDFSYLERIIDESSAPFLQNKGRSPEITKQPT